MDVNYIDILLTNSDVCNIRIARALTVDFFSRGALVKRRLSEATVGAQPIANRSNSYLHIYMFIVIFTFSFRLVI